MLTSEDTHCSPEEFCLALKRARERRGVTLEVIAKSTKVCTAYLVALERGDLRYWPKGLFRRAFFRGYVEMIGLPVAETMAVFVRLFPDDEVAATQARLAPAPPELPLMLDASWHGPRVPIVRRTITAGIDLAVVALAALALSRGVGVELALAVVSAGYFTLAMLLVGESPAAWTLRRRERRPVTPAAASEPVDEQQPVTAGVWQRGLEALRQVWSESTGHPADRDVHQRLRVRVKWSP